MRQWGNNGGFSVDASVRVEAWDRAGLERLLRYCARGPLALERLTWAEDKPETLLYRLTKPLPDGRAALCLTPLELLDRLAVLIPPPRLHRHRYHGVLAPNAPWRAQVAATAGDGPQPSDLGPGTASEKDTGPPSDEHALGTAQRSSSSPSTYLWAILLTRLYEVFPLRCPQCGTEMCIIGFVTDTHSATALGTRARSPRPGRGLRPKPSL